MKIGEKKSIYKNSYGYTLIELIIVLAILGTIVAVAVPTLAGFRSRAEENICVANLKTVERMYTAFLVENNVDHEDSIFDQFHINHFDEVCPLGGIIIYENGIVKCSVHGNEGQQPEEESPGGEVPWL